MNRPSPPLQPRPRFQEVYFCRKPVEYCPVISHGVEFSMFVTCPILILPKLYILDRMYHFSLRLNYNGILSSIENPRSRPIYAIAPPCNSLTQQQGLQQSITQKPITGCISCKIIRQPDIWMDVLCSRACHGQRSAAPQAGCRRVQQQCYSVDPHHSARRSVLLGTLGAGLAGSCQDSAALAADDDFTGRAYLSIGMCPQIFRTDRTIGDKV